MDREVLLREAAGAAVGWDTSRALQLLGELLGGDPDDIEALLLRGHVLEMTNALGDARKDYEHVLDLDPRNVHALVDLADCDQSDGKTGAALERLDQAQSLVEAGLYRLDRDEELEEILERKYKCLLALGRRQEADQILAHGEQLLPDAALWQQLRHLSRSPPHAGSE